MGGITPSSTVGPFFLFGLMPSTIDGTDLVLDNLVTPDATGERIRIEGTVRDGDGAIVPDAVIEIWQADGLGRYVHAERGGVRPNTAFRGFGRAATDADGGFHFDTVKPGAVTDAAGQRHAPHIVAHVFARGVLKQMVTRIYFSDEAEANAADPVLALAPEERRATLIAARADAEGQATYRFDIHLQGEHETVFFAA